MARPTRSGRRSPPARCEHPKDDAACNAATREGKPFCPDHVKDHKYVKHLLRLIASKEDEIERIDKAATLEIAVSLVTPNGIVVSDFMRCLREHGWITRPRLRRETQYSPRVVDAVSNAVIRMRLVEETRSQRGDPALQLLPAGLRWRPSPTKLS